MVTRSAKVIGECDAYLPLAGFLRGHRVARQVCEALPVGRELKPGIRILHPDRRFHNLEDRIPRAADEGDRARREDRNEWRG